MAFEVVTTDKKTYKLDTEHITLSEFLHDIYKLNAQDAKIDILVHSTVFDHVRNFMLFEQVVLEKDYEYEQIRFTDDQKLYIKRLGIDTLVELCKAANYLDYKLLMECTAFYIADAFRNKNMAEIKKLTGGQMTDEERKIAEKEFVWLPLEDMEQE